MSCLLPSPQGIVCYWHWFLWPTITVSVWLSLLMMEFCHCAWWWGLHILHCAFWCTDPPGSGIMEQEPGWRSLQFLSAALSRCRTPPHTFSPSYQPLILYHSNIIFAHFAMTEILQSPGFSQVTGSINFQCCFWNSDKSINILCLPLTFKIPPEEGRMQKEDIPVLDLIPFPMTLSSSGRFASPHLKPCWPRNFPYVLSCVAFWPMLCSMISTQFYL